MYRRVAAILFPITLIAFVAVAAWGYQEHQDKNSILIKAENTYQRAFHDLNNHMDKLQGELGKSLALNTQKQVSNSMTNVWRLAYDAQSDIGQLPLTLMPFDQAEKFLSRVGRFAYSVGIRDLNKHPLNDKEWKTLHTLYNQSKQVRDDLATVQEKVLDKNLRWMDVELAVATEDKKMDNTIIDGFKLVNQKVKEFPEVDWGPSVSNMEAHERQRAKNISGAKITPQQAKQIVARAFGKHSTKGISVTLNKNGDYESYSVFYRGAKNTDVHTELTAKGGHMVWMIYDRPVKRQNLSMEQALRHAQNFLNRIGYVHMVPISHDETGNIVSFNFVHRENGVYIYPETLVVKVALDNGEIMGLQAEQYVFNKIKRPEIKPKLTKAEAKKKLNSHLKVRKSNLALIYNDKGQEVLCYEFLGQIDQIQYRIFINALDGSEEMVDRIEKADADQI
ncbi:MULTISPECIES: germination protein YpeB [Thermoactinomyces]|jgi:spore germination protein|uniref:Germination protein YpeB n=1 Tax=Thermoactinomyces daqus TaxID=1329516 RepID=A0A7W2AIU6_9BACL|nr:MULTISPECIES: germination protein YpeB [Thermoactinomyces]MBA4543119.1 germination protein YpeB [Thermoactinomyces daqus]MBH8596646.1 germination protein YpeB [Thermoactinomyces sp. CICC 10523]